MITTKCGIAKVGPGIMYRDGRPKAIRTICEASLKQLRRETIDLLQLHWVDEDTPIEESVGAIADLVRAGKVRHIGISNVTARRVRARAEHGPDRVGAEPLQPCRPRARRAGRRCAEAGIVFFPYGPLDAEAFAQGAPLADADRPPRRRRARARLHAGPAGAGLAARAQPDHGADPGHDARRRIWRRTSPPPRSG